MEKYLYADLYSLEDTHFWHISKRKTCCKLLSRFLIKSRKLNILDIGCGTGKNIEEFSRFGKVYGIDRSKEAVKYCQKRGIKNVRMDSADKLKFKNKSFDLVTMLDVLEHTDDDKTVKEVRRVLKKNGLLLITVPAFPWLWSKWDEVLHHKRRYTKKTLRKLLEKNAFRVLKISYLYSFLVLPALVIRSIKNFFFKNYYPSDFKMNSSFINKVLLMLANLEVGVLSKINIPFGTTIICIAQKNEK